MADDTSRGYTDAGERVREWMNDTVRICTCQVIKTQVIDPASTCAIHPVWQRCPVCSGTGLVSVPPGVAGDQPTFTTSEVGPWTCRRCAGLGTIATPGSGCTP